MNDNVIRYGLGLNGSTAISVEQGVMEGYMIVHVTTPRDLTYKVEIEAIDLLYLHEADEALQAFRANDITKEEFMAQYLLMSDEGRAYVELDDDVSYLSNRLTTREVYDVWFKVACGDLRDPNDQGWTLFKLFLTLAKRDGISQTKFFHEFSSAELVDWVDSNTTELAELGLY